MQDAPVPAVSLTLSYLGSSDQPPLRYLSSACELQPSGQAVLLVRYSYIDSTPVRLCLDGCASIELPCRRPQRYRVSHLFVGQAARATTAGQETHLADRYCQSAIAERNHILGGSIRSRARYPAMASASCLAVG